jgi:acetyltransferase-like isoleucine patch superfamily enzyme
MGIFSSLSQKLLGFFDWAKGTLRTSEAKGQAVLGRDCLVMSDGRITNIAGIKSRIRVGSHCRIRGEIVTFKHSGSIQIGDWFYLGPRSTIWSSNGDGIKIGHRVLISMDVHIHDTNSHSLDAVERYSQTHAIFTSGHPEQGPNIRSSPVTIGDDVWIGMGASIFKGVRIGNRAVIGSRAIVKTDVPDDGYVPTPFGKELLDK